jgi:hypothetical protein
MAEIQRQRIKSLYGEIKGLLKQLPVHEKTGISPSIGRQYNAIIDDLNSVSGTDYTRSKLTKEDIWPYGDESYYDPTATRAKCGSIVERLEEEFDFGNTLSTNVAPIVVTMNQNQQVTVSVTPLQQIIDSVTDDELRNELEELKQVLDTDKNPKTVSRILNTVQVKSWEVFIKVLPFILEHMGQHTIR